jgi:hypothetical protein
VSQESEKPIKWGTIHIKKLRTAQISEIIEKWKSTELNGKYPQKIYQKTTHELKFHPQTKPSSKKAHKNPKNSLSKPKKAVQKKVNFSFSEESENIYNMFMLQNTTRHTFLLLKNCYQMFGKKIQVYFSVEIFIT